MSPLPSAILRFRAGLCEGFRLSFKRCRDIDVFASVGYESVEP